MPQNLRTDRVMLNTALLMLLAIAGCSPPDMRDQRLAEFAERSMQEQSRQNEHIARQSEAIVQESHKLAEAAQQLVQSDAEARAELMETQQRLTGQLDQQRTAIDTARDQLEQDRKQIAEQRHRDPVVATAIQSTALIIASLLPLIVCIFVIRQMSRTEPEDGAVAELLVSELTTAEPTLLPGPALRPALEHHASRDLPNTASSDVQPEQLDPPF